MCKYIFAVYDSKAEAYLNPFFMPNRAVAERMFGAAVADEKHDFCRFAEDYTLFEIGVYDEETGKISAYDTPRAIVQAIVARNALRKEIVS